MNDMHATIIPKSDQLNADDLITGPITVKITKVTIKPGEQPISIFYDGDNGKPYKCCKSMARIMVYAWGPDSSQYVGRSMTLYRDPAVKWAGMEVGGIRISHMSDISEDMTTALTITRQNKKPFTVRPLLAQSPKASAQAPSLPGSPPSAAPVAEPPTLQATLAAIDAMKGQKSAAACIDMLAELDEAERLIAQEAYDFRVAELKAAGKPKSREAAHNAVLAIEDDKL